MFVFLLIGILYFGRSGRAQTVADRPDRQTSLQASQYYIAEGASSSAPQQSIGQIEPSTEVVIELSDEPAAVTFAARRSNGVNAVAISDARQQVSRIDNAQRQLLPALNAMRAQILYRTQRVYNGIAVRVDQNEIANIRQLPGVKAVRPLVQKFRSTSTSVPFVGAPAVWKSADSNLTGKNIKIGIIDSGIDYKHSDFGGSAGTTFPSTKVAGGFDFVGDAYNGTNTPMPDNDPMDCNGHGTHVAGIAAGFGVNSDGSTYTGVYDQSLPFSTMKIGPGVAPEATLYSLRVFGCDGGTRVTDQAIEWAMDPNGDGDFSDHLDVINLSLGSDYGDTEDTSSIAANNAAAAGVIVVAAAGNAGDSYYAASSPANASKAISVAASIDDGTTTPAVRVDTPPSIAGLYQAIPAAFGPPSPPGPLTAPLVYALPHNACTELTNNSSSQTKMTGAIAMIDGDSCPFLDKAKNAQAAGAIAVLVVRSVPGNPITMGPVDSSITIPCVMISQSDGFIIKPPQAFGGITMSFSSTFAITQPQLSDLVGSFSSRGTRAGDAMLKPDITAPGVSISSAKSGSGSDAVTLSGTSMATPHVAGQMALLRQLHPTWSVNDLKALAMNTAIDDLVLFHTGTPKRYGPNRTGAGRIDLPTSTTGQIIAFDADNTDLVGLSFGRPEVFDTLTLTRRLRIVNKGSVPVHYRISYDRVEAMQGVQITLPDGDLVDIPALGFKDVRVNLSAIAGLFDTSHDDTLAIDVNFRRQIISEEAGFIRIAVDDFGVRPTARVPVYAAPQATAITISKRDKVYFGLGPAPFGYITLKAAKATFMARNCATLYELLETLPPSSGLTGLAKSADLQYVGINNLYNGTLTTSNPVGISFGLATYQDWSTPNQIRFEVAIDTDRDGNDDFLLFNSNAAALGIANQGDALFSALYDVHQQKVIAANPISLDVFDFANKLLDTNLISLLVNAPDLNLSPGNSQFNFKVRTYYRGTLVKTTPTKSYDVTKPGLVFVTNPNGPTITGLELDVLFNDKFASYNPSNYAANGSQGVLIFSHSASSGNRTQILDVTMDNPKPTVDRFNPEHFGTGTDQIADVQIFGSDFSSAATVQLNGITKSATVINDERIQLHFGPNDFPTAGTYTVTVTNPLPGGGVSSPLTFIADNPRPNIATVDPNVFTAGSNGATITLSGQSFVPDSVVQFNGSSRPTTLVSNTKLTATLSAADLLSGPTAIITVFNKAPGGGTSNQSVLTINKGVASLALENLSQTYDGTAKPVSVTSTPASLSGITVTYNGTTTLPVNAGSYEVVATLNNNSFQPATITGTLVIAKADQALTFPQITDKTVYDGPIPLNAVSTSGLTVTYEVSGSIGISGNTAIISGTGTATITAVQNGTNNFNAAIPVSRSFNINNPSPQVLRLNPGAVIAGSNQTTIKISGGNFVTDSLVSIDGANHPATFVNRIEMDLSLSAAELAAPGLKTITIANPAPGGGNSIPITLKVISIVASDSKDIQPGTTDTVSNAPNQNGDAGITAQLNHSVSAGGQAHITVLQYSADPLGGSGLIDVGGGYVDLKVTGAAAGDVLNATFYYGSNVTGTNEDKLQLLYFNGIKWAKVRSSGNTDPLKNTADNQDGTVSGGTFTVTFDETSSPKLSQLTGTIFSSTPGLYGDLNNDTVLNVSDLILMANALAGNTTVDKTAGDLTLDGKLNVNDLILLANFLAGNIAHLPVDKTNSTASNPPDLTAFGLGVGAPHLGIDWWYLPKRRTVATI